MNKNVKVTAFTGGIGSGKTTASRIFMRQGAVVIDADKIGHQALTSESIREKLKKAFGPGILGPDGEIDRGRLGRLVFEDKEKLKTLDETVHPVIVKKIREKINRVSEGMIVIDAALLFEFELDQLCDEIIFIDTDRDLRKKRLSKDRGWADNEIDRREQHQLPVPEKLDKATRVIKNNGSPQDFEEKIKQLWDNLNQDKTTDCTRRY